MMISDNGHFVVELKQDDRMNSNQRTLSGGDSGKAVSVGATSKLWAELKKAQQCDDEGRLLQTEGACISPKNCVREANTKAKLWTWWIRFQVGWERGRARSCRAL